MENLTNQIRARFSGLRQRNTEETSSIRDRDRRIPAQKTQSFKERKKGQNWFQRHFTRQMSQDYDSSNELDYATAVAAATFAISSVEEPGIIPDKKKISELPETSLTKSKSKKEDKTITAPDPGRGSKRFSGEGSMKIPGAQDSKEPITGATNAKAPERPIAPAPSIKKHPTFAEQLASTGSIKPETAPPKPEVPKTPKPSEIKRQDSFRPGAEKERQSSMKPQIPPTETKRQSSTRPGVGETTSADAWEKAELAKIKERYEKLNSTILTWEEKKKAKAKRKLDNAEREVEQRRAKALQDYRDNMQNINQIAGGAKEKAKENQRNEELKAKEKANIIRTTGKAPKTCFCF